MSHTQTSPAAPDAHGSAGAHDPVVAGPTPEELADSRRAEKSIARVVGPLGLLAFVVGAGLAVASWSVTWLPLWLLVSALGLAAWRESKALRAA